MSTLPAGSVIARYLTERLPRYWDGKACIQELRHADYQWKQMEWIGWWFEYRAMQLLAPLGAQVGPTFGSVTFDCSLISHSQVFQLLLFHCSALGRCKLKLKIEKRFKLFFG